MNLISPLLMLEFHVDALLLNPSSSSTLQSNKLHPSPPPVQPPLPHRLSSRKLLHGMKNSDFELHNYEACKGEQRETERERNPNATSELQLMEGRARIEAP